MAEDAVRYVRSVPKTIRWTRFVRPYVLAECKWCGLPFPMIADGSRSGFCSRECSNYQRWQDQIGDTSARFLENVSPEPNTGCWLWAGCTSHGYGKIGVGGKYDVASRVSWKLFRGEIPGGLEVCHKCDVSGVGPPCVNPDHLFLGTHADNMADFKAKGRARNQFPRRLDRVSREP